MKSIIIKKINDVKHLYLVIPLSYEGFEYYLDEAAQDLALFDFVKQSSCSCSPTVPGNFFSR